MSAVTINDIFIQLMKEKEPTIFSKIKDTQFGIIQISTGEYQAFFASGSLSDNDKQKVQPLFWQAIKLASEK